MTGGSTRTKEYDQNGNYIDTKIHLIERKQLDNIKLLTKTKILAGVSVSLHSNEDEIPRTYDINQINQQGVGADVFRCPFEDCHEAFPRRWCVERHFAAIHNGSERGKFAYRGHITMSTYPYGKPKSQYKRRAKEDIEAEKRSNGGALRGRRRIGRRSPPATLSPLMDPGTIQKASEPTGPRSVDHDQLACFPDMQIVSGAPGMSNSYHPAEQLNEVQDESQLSGSVQESEHIAPRASQAMWRPGSGSHADQSLIESRDADRSDVDPGIDLEAAEEDEIVPVEPHPIFMYPPLHNHSLQASMSDALTLDELSYPEEPLESLTVPYGPYNPAVYGPYWCGDGTCGFQHA